jgi:hypothetical protein
MWKFCTLGHKELQIKLGVGRGGVKTILSKHFGSSLARNVHNIVPSPSLFYYEQQTWKLRNIFKSHRQEELVFAKRSNFFTLNFS